MGNGPEVVILKQRRLVDFDEVVNQIIKATKKALEDRKTSIFTLVVLINVFLWGVAITNQKHLEISNQDLKDKNELYQVTNQINEKKIGLLDYRLSELNKKVEKK